ncbi:hypothetical protein LXL04_014589 [Taraxacum kok-saghyz]
MNFKTSPFLFFFVLFISICCFLTVTSGCLIKNWTVSITSEIPNDIVVHIKSTDHDLGDHTISAHGIYTWQFCSKLVGTHFTGDFSWGSRHQSLALMDAKISRYCNKRLVGDDECYWLVKPNGFYVSFNNASFPWDWAKKKSW